MTTTTNYQKWRGVTDKIYSGELTAEKGATALIELLVENGIKLRANNNQLIAISFFVYDKDDYRNNPEKPLGLGAVYLKPDQTKTQDIFIVLPSGKIEKYYSQKKLKKKYPWLKNVHKRELPV
jgi:hypothetical protein